MIYIFFNDNVNDIITICAIILTLYDIMLPPSQVYRLISNRLTADVQLINNRFPLTEQPLPIDLKSIVNQLHIDYQAAKKRFKNE